MVHVGKSFRKRDGLGWSAKCLASSTNNDCYTPCDHVRSALALFASKKGLVAKLSAKWIFLTHQTGFFLCSCKWPDGGWFSSPDVVNPPAKLCDDFHAQVLPKNSQIFILRLHTHKEPLFFRNLKLRKNYAPCLYFVFCIQFWVLSSAKLFGVTYNYCRLSVLSSRQMGIDSFTHYNYWI